MSRPLISSLSNPLVKHARSLRQRKARAESGLFLVEGLHPVGEALEAGWDLESILYAPEVMTSGFAQELLGQASDFLQPVTSEVMQSLADKENPQGIVAVVHQKRAALSELQDARNLVAMVSPQDPGNVGTVLRTIDAVGADAMVLADGGVDPYHPTSVRASMGALFWKPIVQTAFADLMEWCQANGIQRIATSAHAKADYRDVHPASAWILVLGNEQKGLSTEMQAACDLAVSMPMKGRASSLNVAVAAGVLLYQFIS